jgi:hypothetical protein
MHGNVNVKNYWKFKMLKYILFFIHNFNNIFVIVSNSESVVSYILDLKFNRVNITIRKDFANV